MATVMVAAVLVLGLGLSVLYGGRRVGLGAWLGRLSRRVGRSGTQFDDYLRQGPAIPVRSVLWAFANGYAPWLSFADHPVYLAVLALLVPVFGMGSAALFMGEALPAWKLGAAALVLSGLAINLLWPRLRPQRGAAA